jgi:glycosyltransferase involved in cell wall biosynthesis
MPEVSGNAAHLVDPYIPAEITQAMVRLTNDKQYCNDLVNKGFTQALQFSWQKMAENVLEIYESIYQTTK